MLLISAIAIVGFGLAAGTNSTVRQAVINPISNMTSSHGNGSCPMPPPPKLNRSYIIIEPRMVALDVNSTITFTAKEYDKDGNLISGLTFTWSVMDHPPMPLSPPNQNGSHPSPPPIPTNSTHPIIGTIDGNGLFTATADGRGCVVAETNVSGDLVVGVAFVQVGGQLPGPMPPLNGNGSDGQMPPPPDGNGGNLPPPPKP